MLQQHQIDSRRQSSPQKSTLTEALSKRPKTSLPHTIPEENPISEGSLLTTPTFSTDNYSPKKTSKGPSTHLNTKHNIGNQSMIINNSDMSPLKGSIKQYSRSPSNMAESLNMKTMRGFGTFVAEKGKLNKAATMTMAQHSSILSKSSDVSFSMKFLEKEDWVEEKHCHICTRGFNKINRIFEHHCRICGRGVCGECSGKKINDNRVCNVCYFKADNKRAEERREDQLTSKHASIKTYKKQLMKEKDHLNELIQKRYNLQKTTEEEKEEQKKAIKRLQEEKEKLDVAFQKKKETNTKLKESVASDTTFMREKEIEFDLLKNKINYLRLQITQKKNNLESKQEELLRLKYHKARYQESPSFINLINTMQSSGKGPTMNDINSENASIVVDITTPQFYIKTKV